MANGVLKPADDEFDSPTNVIESGLLRVLTKKSSAEHADTGGWSAIADEPRADETVSVPSRRRRSPLIVGAAIVAAVVISADLMLVVAYRQRARPPQPPPPPAATSLSLPRYMVLPDAPPRPPVPAAALPVAPAAPPIAAMPAVEPKPRAHKHHKRQRAPH